MLEHKYDAIITSPLGAIGILLTDDKITRINLLAEDLPVKLPRSDAGKKAVEEIKSYFSNATQRFSFPYEIAGTPFQKSVWKLISEIPPGETRSYGELAKQLQTGPRAIGQACRTNKLHLVIPCHRVVASKHMGGYAGVQTGKWLEIKKWLLEFEGAI